MDNEEFFIGEAAKDNKKTYEKKSNFFLKEGDNFYRILPPVRSLAKDGVWAKYWRIHFVAGAKTKQDGSTVKYPIVCVEKSDYKTKVITHNCPICDIAHEAQREYDLLEKSGKVSPQELSAFKRNRIQAFEGNGKYYVNAVNSEGKIGVLGLPKTAKDSFQALCDRLEAEENIKPMSMNGIYVNFIRSVNEQKRTSYSCTAMMVPSKENPKLKGYREHIIDTPFVEKLKKDSVDLSKVYTPLSLEDLRAIGNASPDQRGKIADAVISKGRTETTKQVGALETNIPGTGATGIARIDLDTATSQLKVTAPEAPNPGFTAPKATVAAAAPAASSSPGNMDDDEEFRKFMEKHK
jgi:hypothetical protein